MATKRTRKTAEQLLADYQDKVAKLQEKLDKKKTANLIKLGKVVQTVFGEEITPKQFTQRLDNFDGIIKYDVVTSQIKKLTAKITETFNAKKISQDDYDKLIKFLDSFNNNVICKIFRYRLNCSDKNSFDENFIKFMLDDVINGDKFEKAVLNGNNKYLSEFFSQKKKDSGTSSISSPSDNSQAAK